MDLICTEDANIQRLVRMGVKGVADGCADLNTLDGIVAGYLPNQDGFGFVEFEVFLVDGTEGFNIYETQHTEGERTDTDATTHPITSTTSTDSGGDTSTTTYTWEEL